MSNDQSESKIIFETFCSRLFSKPRSDNSRCTFGHEFSTFCQKRWESPKIRFPAVLALQSLNCWHFSNHSQLQCRFHCRFHCSYRSIVAFIAPSITVFIAALIAALIVALIVALLASLVVESVARDCNTLPISTSIYYHKYVVNIIYDINMQCESFGIISATINIIYVNI